MPADMSAWTLQSIGTCRNAATTEAVKLNDVENFKTGEAVRTVVQGWSTTMKVVVASAMLLVVVGIIVTVIILATMGGGFLKMPIAACTTEGKSHDYIPIGFSASANAFTEADGTIPKVKSDLLYYYILSEACAEYTGPMTGENGWVPLYLNQKDNKPTLPDAWTLKASDLMFGAEHVINDVKMYPLHMKGPGDVMCKLYYKVGDASTEANRYDFINNMWPAIDHSGAMHATKPTCVYSPPSPPPPP